LTGRPVPEPQFPNVNTALFVTWNKSGSSGEHRLRGCIGTLTPRMSHTGLRDYALTSALRDSRFNPITAAELPRLSCKVSLLSCFEEARGWDDWTVGVHGIQIEFVDPEGHTRSATYLPEVAPEQGWDVAEAITSLLRKAGYNGPVIPGLLAAIRLVRYQSSVCALTYDQYCAMAKGKGGVPAPALAAAAF